MSEIIPFLGFKSSVDKKKSSSGSISYVGHVWYMARLVVKNGHQQDMCYYELGSVLKKLYHSTEHNWEVYVIM